MLNVKCDKSLKSKQDKNVKCEKSVKSKFSTFFRCIYAHDFNFFFTGVPFSTYMYTVKI